ncbi:alpha/beta hydrolase-fold protein [Brevibacterium sp. 91QC2O2]|uniref:alpha/beta hydrolase n=1 Tax=Brevibacterium sp. 91QC2O2 TaxID=2968458 RepID=UPI00211C73BA|nr:alpha/beta hydrolase-fold protein [Brevibacterium sp. 91QC2O2]MCQ9367684.1 alpha/beta hydrolase-fold protein [Brevibacterium sp. 91QC2O2]
MTDAEAVAAFDPWRPGPRPRVVHRVPVRSRALTAPLHDVPSSAPEVLGPVEGSAGTQVWVRFLHFAPDARAVALAPSGWWNPDPVDALDLHPVGGTGWFVAEVAAPADWIAGYRFAEYRGRADPPWWTTGLKRLEHPDVRMSADCANPRRLTVKGGARTSLICVSAINAAAHPVLDLFLTPESWPEHVQVHRLGDDTGGPIGPPGKGPGDMDGGPAVWWWAASSAGTRETPLIVFFDGEAHVRNHDTPRFLAAAVEAGLLPPVAAVFVESGPNRAQVLGVPGGRAQWVARTLVPRLLNTGLESLGTGRVRISRDPLQRIVTGSSFGGLSTLFTLATDPGACGTGIVQSPSLWRYPEGDFAELLARALARGAVPKSQRKPGGTSARMRLRLAAGRFEGNAVARCAGLHAELGGLGLEVGPAVTAVSGGHDWSWWIPHSIAQAAELLR